MPYKIIFLIGLLFEVLGQVLLAQGNDFVYQLRPIDFAHWSLLVGVVCLMPQVVSFPNKIFSYIGIPIAIIGIVCIIGMCVLDFVWWSQPNQEVRNEFAAHLHQFPVIWKPFISHGPNFLNVGLLILSFNYWKAHKISVSLIILATLMLFNVIPIPFKLISVYIITFLGFATIFFQDNNRAVR